ncbi:MAG: metallophosphoesterase family protein [Armatimonadetes bacterium]|nr:metallophosphoesterase family protein [Armatimonadota bacterium]
MRIGVVSDVHANLEALEAVLAHQGSQPPDMLVCLGDFVGYGPDPNACVERLRPLLWAAVMGNHDQAALSDSPTDNFNFFAQEAIVWTRQVLEDGPRAYLSALSPRADLTADPAEGATEDPTLPTGLVLVHGSLRRPLDEYILDGRTARASFLAAPFQIALVGHTHHPAIFVEAKRRVSTQGLLPEVPRALTPGARYIINPGSVGQPRDGDPRAAYMVLDTQGPTATLFRVPYPIEETQRKMDAAGLPVPLIERLSLGR